MKTPKEYAIELYESFFYCIHSISDEGKIEHETAKQCALIAVEMLMSEIILLNAGRVYIQFHREKLEYLSEVKQELEKL